MHEITIGRYRVGPKAPPVVVAEIGINHNGNIELAKEMIEKAAENGADLIKLQSMQAEKFLAPDTPYYGVIESLSFNFREQEELFRFAKEKEATLFAAPFDTETADFLEEMDVPAFKIASMDCNNLPLLRHVARKKKPIFLATGMAEMNEVDTALKTIEKEGNSEIILMHCISDYPPDPSDINLNVIKTLGDAFGLPVGFSDHSLGLGTAFAAGAIGAAAIEKHFTLDRNMQNEFSYSDHSISIEPDELSALSHYCKSLRTFMGGSEKILSKNEINNRDKFRRGIYAARDLAVGQRLSETDCIALRPVTGVPVSQWDEVIGRELLRDIKKGEPIEFGYLTGGGE